MRAESSLRRQSGGGNGDIQSEECLTSSLLRPPQQVHATWPSSDETNEKAPSEAYTFASASFSRR